MRSLFGAIALAATWLWQPPQFVPAPGSPLEVGEGSGTILLADVNGDRHVDLLTRHLLTNRINVQIGDGRGGFRPAAKSAIAFDYRPGDMALGDLDNDGALDLVVTPGDRDLLDVLIGNGTGGFTRTAGSPITVTTEIEPLNKRTLHLVDLDEDGKLDAVTANGRRRNSFAIMFGNGRGGFVRGPIVELDTGQDGYALAFGDMNGDGHLDVVNASRAGYDDRSPGRMIVLDGDGKGGFRRRSAAMTLPAGPRWLQLGDLNRDSRLDVVVAHPNRVLSIMLNDGRGSFVAASPQQLPGETHFFQLLDVDRDGHSDLVAPTVDSVTVLLGDRGTFRPAPGSPFRAGPGAYHVGVGDIDEDGRLDLVASSFGGSAVTVLLGRQRRGE
jgi:hypothetical protein